MESACFPSGGKFFQLPEKLRDKFQVCRRKIATNLILRQAGVNHPFQQQLSKKILLF